MKVRAMTKKEYSAIDSTLYEVHNVLTRMMQLPVGYKLKESDLEVLEIAEEKHEKARSALALLPEE